MNMLESNVENFRYEQIYDQPASHLAFPSMHFYGIVGNAKDILLCPVGGSM